MRGTFTITIVMAFLWSTQTQNGFSAFQPPQWSNAPQLRSAYLRPYESPAAERSSEPERVALQEHFRVVVVNLLASTPQSIAIGADRLEEHLKVRWTSTQRTRAQQVLLRRRYVQIARLVYYAANGQFPQNVYSDRAVPVFVDQNNTACAVGQLMRWSGHGADVSAIATIANHVVVADVKQGPLVKWLVQSGLTQEEAALIQPTYCGHPRLDRVINTINREDVIDAGNGLILDNINFTVLVHPSDDLVDASNGIPWDSYREAFNQYGDQLQNAPTDDIGLAFGTGAYCGPYVQLKDGPWLSLHDDSWWPTGIPAGTGLLGTDTYGAGLRLFKFDYRVRVSDSEKRIGEFGVFGSENALFGFDFFGHRGLHTTISTDSRELAELSINSFDNSFSEMLKGRIESAIDSQVELQVSTVGFATRDAEWVGFFHEFGVVPEPTAGSCTMIGILFVTWFIRRFN